MIDEKPFFSPTLTGKRFEDHSVPLEILSDFSAFEDLLKALARQLYLDEHPGRKRVPNGFTDDISLNLQSMEEGSTILNFFLATVIGGSSLLPVKTTKFTYFEKAKDKVIEIVAAAESGKDLDSVVGKKYLNYFNRIGRNLKPDEEILLLPDKQTSPKLNKETRKKIMLSASADNTYTDKYHLKVLIDTLNKTDKKFSFLIDNQSFETSLNPAFYKIILETFSDLENDKYVLIKGDATFNSSDKIIKIDTVTSLDMVPSLDVSTRLRKLSKLKDGWLDGSGKSLNKKNISIFESTFYDYFSERLTLPSIFPTPDGNIQLEWSFNRGTEISLEIDLKTMDSELFVFQVMNNEEIFHQINILEADSWKIINETISKFDER